MNRSLAQRLIAVGALLAMVALPIAIAQNVGQARNQPALGQRVEVRAAKSLVVAPGQIEGQVLLPDGKPAGSHLVTVCRANGTTMSEHTADEQGRFKCELPTGRYQLSASKGTMVSKGMLDVEAQEGAESVKIVMFVQADSSDNTTMIIGGVAAVAGIAGITLGTLAIIDNNSEDTDIFGQNNRQKSSSSSSRRSSSSASPAALSPAGP